jgi:hypothetical protein
LLLVAVLRSRSAADRGAVLRSACCSWSLPVIPLFRLLSSDGAPRPPPPPLPPAVAAALLSEAGLASSETWRR